MYVDINESFHSRTTELIIEDNRRIFNFVTHKWDNIPEGTAISQEKYVFSVPTTIFNAIAQKMKTLDNIPDKTKSYQEGKIESLEKHLEDMRKLVFRKK